MGMRAYRIGKNNNPFQTCMDCPNRRVGCHSKCEAYKEAVAEHEANKTRYYREKLYIAGDQWEKGFSKYKVEV